MEPANCYGQTESARAGAAGVEEEHAVANVRQRLMRVATDNAIDIRRSSLQFANVVNKEEFLSGSFHGESSGKFARPGFDVDVPANGMDGSDLLQLVEDRRIADVSGMQNQFASAQCGHGLRAKEAVSVRDDPYMHLVISVIW